MNPAALYSETVPHNASNASLLPKASCISKRADLPNLINGFEYWPPVTVLSGPSWLTFAIFNVSKIAKAFSSGYIAKISSTVLGSVPL